MFIFPLRKISNSIINAAEPSVNRNSDPDIQPAGIFVSELCERAFVKLIAYALHERVVEPQVVQHAQPHAEHLTGFVEVPDIAL